MGAIERKDSIAAVVGGRPELDGALCVDSLNRVWKIIRQHSGCELKGSKHPAVIPYWTCYFIALPELRVIGRDPGLSWHKESPTLLEELLRLSVTAGDLLKDQSFGLLWIVRVSEYGLSLEGYNDNHWMPQESLGVLGFGTLTRLSTEAQRKSRKLEHV